MKLWPQTAFLLFVVLRLFGVLFTPQKCNNDDAWHGIASHRPIDNAARLSHISSVFQTSADVAASCSLLSVADVDRAFQSIVRAHC